MNMPNSFSVIYDSRLPPCNAQCPSGHDIQGWLAQAAQGEYRRAWEIMMDNNPLPATMGRVCYHTCEGACNRKEFDQAVNIHALERFIGDLALKQGWQVTPAAASGKKNPGGRRRPRRTLSGISSGPARPFGDHRRGRAACWRDDGFWHPILPAAPQHPGR